MKASLTEQALARGAPPRETLRQRLDPRRHMAAALGWTVFVLVVAGALVAAELAAGAAERHVLAEIHARLGQTAAQTADALMAQIEVRLAALQAAAAQWRLAATGDATTADRLRALQRLQPAFSWIGVRGRAGQVQVATDGADASAGAPPPWLSRAQRAPLVVLHRGGGAGAGRALVLAVPLAAHDAAPAGILEARLPWLWLQAQVDARVRALRGGAPVEVVLLDSAGRLLAGPPGLQHLEPGADLSEGGRYLIGQPPADADAAAVGTGWRVVVRESARTALAQARETRRAVLGSVLAVGLLAALAVVVATRRLLRRLDELARQARAVRSGARPALDVPAGRDEVHAIGTTLAELVGHLQDEKAALARLNAELDARVAARAARIQQLAEDARQAAVTRERLRLARGLHDTLAHSLMALLTQIRMVRKLGAHWSRAQIDAELAQAEQAAASGLAEARAAIAQVRSGGLHDSDLAAALRELAARVGERSRLAVDAQLDPRAAELVGARAATVLNMAREALRNAERHARARQIRLSLAPEAPAVEGDGPCAWRLEVADDGRGFDPAAVPAGHYGLTGLREQAAQLGATLELDSAPGRGSRVRLRFLA